MPPVSLMCFQREQYFSCHSNALLYKRAARSIRPLRTAYIYEEVRDAKKPLINLPWRKVGILSVGIHAIRGGCVLQPPRIALPVVFFPRKS